MAVVDEVAKRAVTSANRVPPGVPAGPHTMSNGNGQPQSGGEIERERLRMMMLIRRFEERTYQEYTKPGQKIGGFCHLYSGQEAIAVGIAAAVREGQGLPGQRLPLPRPQPGPGHGPARGDGRTVRQGHRLLQGQGRVDALLRRRGRQHGRPRHRRRAHPARPRAWPSPSSTRKPAASPSAFMGDGAINQGTHNESLNLASLLQSCRAIFIVENNGVAMGTQVERHSAEKDLAERGCGYNMPHYNIDGNDVDTVIARIRQSRRARPPRRRAELHRRQHLSLPRPLDVRRDEVPQTKEGAWRRPSSRDPITLYESPPAARRACSTDEQVEAMQEEVAEQVERRPSRQADADPHPPLEDRFNDVLAEKYPYQPRK